MPTLQGITACLWFESQAGEALMTMKKLDIAVHQRTPAGQAPPSTPPRRLPCKSSPICFLKAAAKRR